MFSEPSLVIPAIIVPAFAALVLAFVASRSRQEAGARSFTWLMLAIAAWGLGNCLERVSPYYSQKLFWANMQYFGLVGVPIAWLALGLDFTGRPHWLTRGRFLAIATVPLLVILVVWTDPAHGLLRGRLRNPDALIEGAFSVIQFEPRPVFWVNVGYSYALMTIGTLLMLQAFFQGHRHYRAQAAVMLLGAIVPWISNVTYMLGMNFLATYDVTPFAFSLTVLSSGWCILRYRFLDLVPVARAMVMESMNDPVIVLDDLDRVLDMNPAAQRFSAGHWSDHHGEPIDRVFPDRPDLITKLGDRREAVEEVTLVEGGNHRQFDMRISPLHDWSGRFTGRVVVLRDISARKRAEEANRASQSQYRALMQQASDGIYVSDPEGRIVAANARGCELVGCTEAELIGRSVHDFLTAEEILNDPMELDELKSGKRVLKERRVRHKDGTLIPVEVSATMLADGRFQAIARDITDRKRAEEERRRLEAQIQHTQKLESLGVLAGGIAHDFNNLLVGVMGNAGLALLETPIDSPARPYVEQVENASKRASELCRQMLAYSGRGTFDVKPFDLGALVREMVKLLDVSISKKVSLQFVITDNLPAVEGDAAQIQQVVMNLITNASEAIGVESGTVTVRIGVVEATRSLLSKSILNEDLPEGRYARLDVRDSGVGMDPQTRARIFDPFFSTKFTGRGLGLSAVLGIVRSHRGAIFVESELGTGTEVSVLLPITDRPVARRFASSPEDRFVGKGTILVVDDEDTVRVVASRILHRHGFEVLTACNGREGVELFRAHADKVRVILLDMTMPEMSGEEALREILEIRPQAPIILSSGYNDLEDAQSFEGSGNSVFLQKPYGPRELVEKVRELITKPTRNGKDS